MRSISFFALIATDLNFPILSAFSLLPASRVANNEKKQYKTKLNCKMKSLLRYQVHRKGSWVMTDIHTIVMNEDEIEVLTQGRQYSLFCLFFHHHLDHA